MASDMVTRSVPEGVLGAGAGAGLGRDVGTGSGAGRDVGTETGDGVGVETSDVASVVDPAGFIEDDGNVDDGPSS